DFETTLGDYKQVAGVYFPYSFESGAKGSPFKQKITLDKVEVNVPLAESRFVEPKPGGQPPAAAAPDASNMQPKTQEQKKEKQPAEEPKKPPQWRTGDLACPDRQDCLSSTIRSGR